MGEVVSFCEGEGEVRAEVCCERYRERQINAAGSMCAKRLPKRACEREKRSRAEVFLPSGARGCAIRCSDSERCAPAAPRTSSSFLSKKEKRGLLARASLPSRLFARCAQDIMLRARLCF